MNGKQSKRVRRLIYKKDFSFRARHYMWDKPPDIVVVNGVKKLKTGSIQSDSRRQLYKQIKKFFNQGTSLPQLKLLVDGVQA